MIWWNIKLQVPQFMIDSACRRLSKAEAAGPREARSKVLYITLIDVPIMYQLFRPGVPFGIRTEDFLIAESFLTLNRLAYN